jgi:hypothetical protein
VSWRSMTGSFGASLVAIRVPSCESLSIPREKGACGARTQDAEARMTNG